jgi:hypothetical protein
MVIINGKRNNLKKDSMYNFNEELHIKKMQPYVDKLTEHLKQHNFFQKTDILIMLFLLEETKFIKLHGIVSIDFLV